MGYLKTTISAVSWSVATRWVLRGLSFVKLAILARILLPSQFGVFGIATLILGFLEMVTETWVNVFLVQEEGEIDAYVDTAWIVSIVRGIFIFIIIYLASIPISTFFSSPQSLPVIRLISFVPLVRGFINPSEAKMQKNLLFRREFAFRSGLFITEAALAIIVSILTRNAIGLGVGMLVSAIAEVFLSFIMFNPRPKFVWSKQVARLIINRGKWVTAAGILNYVYQNGDNVVVGKMLGTTSLGLYDPAYKISGLPVSEVSDVVAKVTFPVFVKLRHDLDRLHKAFYQTFIISNLITISIGLTIFLFSKLVILIILGSNWLPAVSALRVLCLCGISKAVISSIYPLFLATKNQQFITWVTFVSSLILLLTIFPAVSAYGLVGAGISAALGSLVALPLAFFYVHKIFKTSISL